MTTRFYVVSPAFQTFDFQTSYSTFAILVLRTEPKKFDCYALENWEASSGGREKHVRQGRILANLFELLVLTQKKKKRSSGHLNDG